MCVLVCVCSLMCVLACVYVCIYLQCIQLLFNSCSLSILFFVNPARKVLFPQAGYIYFKVSVSHMSGADTGGGGPLICVCSSMC